MSDNDLFSYKIEKNPETGWNIVTLIYENPNDYSQNKVVKICPDAGDNLFYFRVGEYEIMPKPDSITEIKSVYYGVPVLYPTPNRVRDCKYTFNGEEIFQVKNDKARYIHGLVYDEAWEFEEPLIKENSVTLKTHLTIDKNSNLFYPFPFENTIRLNFTLTNDRLRFDYEVENRGEKPLPYGFALHPYFIIFGEREENRIQVDVEKVFEAINLLPTGKLLDVKETPQDIRKLTSLNKLDLDHVYYGITPESKVKLIYDKINLQIKFRASEEFTHLVVFTPPKKNFFCIENQTCSTDAHNMHAKGYRDIANLLILEPGEKKSGWIEFKPEWINK